MFHISLLTADHTQNHKHKHRLSAFLIHCNCRFKISPTPTEKVSITLYPLHIPQSPSRLDDVVVVPERAHCRLFMFYVKTKLVTLVVLVMKENAFFPTENQSNIFSLNNE